MIFPRQTSFKLLAGLLLVADTLSALAQNWTRSEDETHWLLFHPDYASLGVFGEYYDQKVTGGDSSYRETRTFFGPSIGLAGSGSVYHPNLIEYRLTLDGSLGWDEETYDGSGLKGKSEQLRFLGMFGAELMMLDGKPFHGRLYANYMHSYQDYDFFNRIYVDTWRYGGVANYTTGPWRFTGQAYRVTEDATGNLVPRSSDTQTASLDVGHVRKGGSTSLSGTLTHYDRNDSGFSYSGTDYLLSLVDTESFGGRKQYYSTVNASYNHLENSTAPTDLYNLMGSLRADHTERLSSYHQVNYSHNNYGSSTYDSVNGSSSLQHRLFDSLVSSVAVQGYSYTAKTGPSQQDSWQVGISPGLGYIKRLGTGSSLSINESLGFFHTDVQSSGGVISTDEAHTFNSGAGGEYFTLSQPKVIGGTIMVSSGPNGSGIIYDPVLDGYEVVPNGQLTMIHRLPGSTLPDSVYVHYDFDASDSGAYETLNHAFGVRLDMFNGLWSVYARLNNNRNYGAKDIVVQDLDDIILGTELHWRFARAGVEYEIYDSSLSPYDALRMFQNFTFKPDAFSTIGVNFSETYMSYGTSGRREENYRAVLRYNQRLTSHFSGSLELGVNQRNGKGVDQTLAVIRPELRYAVGKFSAVVGYDFGYDEYLNTLQRVSNRGYIRLRKDF